MRICLVSVLVLCACAPAHYIRRDPVPDPVVSAESHVVAVYFNATCDTLDQATASGNGFFIAPRVVVTVDHIMKYQGRSFPDFAVIRPDGTCYWAQYADRDSDVDVLLLLVHGRDAHPLELAATVPKIGERIYTFSVADADRTPLMAKRGAPVPFNRVAGRRLPFKKPQLNRFPKPQMFSATPQHREGDSGSPALDAEGHVVGMLLALALNRDTGVHEADAFVSAYIIRRYLDRCGPCEER